MDGLWIASVFATALALLLGRGFLRRLAPPAERRFLVTLFALQLPMCALALFALRLPVLEHIWLWLAARFHPHLPPALLRRTTAYLFFKMFDAPLAEELAKLWPLALPWFHRGLTRADRTRVGMALGLGFGVGELWTIAYLVHRAPGYVPHPAWAYGGFVYERLLVCLIHGAFTATAIRGIGRHSARALLGAMALHFVGNFPIFLARVDVPPFGRALWPLVLLLWVLAFASALLALQSRRLFGRVSVGRLFYGRARCPGCETVYARSLLALNLGARRLERCPGCKRWHLVGRDREVREFDTD